jgi:hypothetical protein
MFLKKKKPKRPGPMVQRMHPEHVKEKTRKRKEMKKTQ